MKKIFLAIFIFGLFISSSYAAPCYGTKLPEKKHFFIGLQNHTILKRCLDGNNGKMKSMQDFLLLSYGVFDWLSIDLKGGVGNIKQHPVSSGRIDYPSFLGGGYGLRIKFLDCKKAKMVLGFQHISVHPYSIYIGDIKHKAVLDDWQFSLLGSYSFNRLIPYIGGKWSRADYIHWQDGNRKRIKSDLTKSIGLVCGLDLSLTEKLWVNVEGQFFDTEAFSFSLNYGF